MTTFVLKAKRMTNKKNHCMYNVRTYYRVGTAPSVPGGLGNASGWHRYVRLLSFVDYSLSHTSRGHKALASIELYRSRWKRDNVTASRRVWFTSMNHACTGRRGSFFLRGFLAYVWTGTLRQPRVTWHADQIRQKSPTIIGIDRRRGSLTELN